ncbi:DUF4397 domain-containing protein [Pedobacter agri]|uniref:DUF4397 domain-containing protein n=1 Tax=Pedobacter agri TaxID=454586 RepID=UPI00277F0456|nr:DUF4397 domain-containing protein [Pedobacter agri]MDQ1141000.1 hypothetical protein [Pedobacter agri]
MKKLLYILAASIGLLSSCSKESDYENVENTEYEKLAPADPKYSYLKVLNLTPGSPVANYYIDGTKFSAALASSGIENSGYTYNGLFPDFGYAVTTPGSHKFTAKIIPTATADANLEILSTTINPEAGKYYTIYTTGLYSATNKALGAPFVLEDVKPALDTSKIFIRLVNLATGLPNIDIVRGSLVTDPKVITNIGYGKASDWVSLSNLGPGASPLVPLLYVNTATGTALSNAGTITLSKGRAYTLYIRGIFGTTGTTAVTTTFYTTFF